MKITYLHQYFNTPDTPGSSRSFEMARRLVEMGHEVNMITTWRNESKNKGWFTTQVHGINVHWLPVPYSNHLNFWQRIQAFLKFAVFSTIKASKINTDIILATSTPLTIGIPGVLASKIKKVPLVFEVRDLWPEMPIAMGYFKNPVVIKLLKRFEKWIYFNSSSIIALSPGMRDGILKTGYPATKIAVIPNGSDIDKFQNIIGDNAFSEFVNNPSLVYTGAMGKLNGVDYLVDLAELLAKQKSNIKIYLFGDGSELKQIISKAKQKNVLDINLFYLGKVPKVEVPLLLAQAKISSVLFIDLKEMQVNSANKFFDSLAAGKPIFLNFGGWMNDLVINYNCGISSWRRPLDEVAKELDLKLNDEKWIKETGSRSLELAKKYFDRDMLFNQFEQVLSTTFINKSKSEVKNIAPGNYDFLS
jgi:glycosyltransferase involved in cell wall biosynthesis